MIWPFKRRKPAHPDQIAACHKLSSALQCAVHEAEEAGLHLDNIAHVVEAAAVSVRARRAAFTRP
jgi:hypothetical protein